MKVVIVCVIALSLSGCSVVFPKAAPQLAKAVTKYCTTLSEEERKILRAQVNEAIKPNEAYVYCDGDARPPQ